MYVCIHIVKKSKKFREWKKDLKFKYEGNIWEFFTFDIDILNYYHEKWNYTQGSPMIFQITSSEALQSYPIHNIFI